MTTGIVKDTNVEKQIEKHIGCMAGFLQLFDRHQLLIGKRFCARRLPPSPAEAVAVMPPSEKPDGSPAISREIIGKQQQTPSISSPSPDRLKPTASELRSPTPSVLEMPPKSPLPLPIFELKEGRKSSWKFCKEAPRLSLDSRATVDAKGSLHPREIRNNAVMLPENRCECGEDGVAADGDDKQRRSPSVIARLMGLEQLPHSSPQPLKKAELRRSASESRVSRDLFQYRSADGIPFQMKQPHQSHFIGTNITISGMRDKVATATANILARPIDPIEYSARNAVCELRKTSKRGGGASPRKTPQQRKSFYDSADIFPEPKQKMRGIDEPSKDLETLKRILEALQFKGLLHSRKTPEQVRHRNIVYDDRNYSFDEPPILITKHSRSPVSPINRRSIANESPPPNLRSKAGVRRSLNLAGELLPSASPKRERPGSDRNVLSPTRTRNPSSPTRSESAAKRPNSTIKTKSLSIETRRKGNDEPTEHRRESPFYSPKLNSKRFGADQSATTRSPRNKRLMGDGYSKEKITGMVTEDESSSISESTVSSSSHTDTEISKTEEYKKGRNLLERCDKLLHSIAEMTTSTSMQLSPVSVLDSSFYKDESSFSPSPIMKRTIHFKDETWSPRAASPFPSKSEDDSGDCDFVYVSEILRASKCLPEDSDIFLLLEKRQHDKGMDTSKASKLYRKLIFDTITEILERNRQLPPWKVYEPRSGGNNNIAKPSLRQIWSEFQRFRDRDATDDLVEVVSGVLKKDLAGDAVSGWGDYPANMSDAILDTERLIFKDLVCETIRDLAALVRRRTVSPPRRKLFF